MTTFKFDKEHKWYKVYYFPCGIENGEWIEVIQFIPESEWADDEDFSFTSLEEANDFKVEYEEDYPDTKGYIYVVEETRKIVHIKED